MEERKQESQLSPGVCLCPVYVHVSASGYACSSASREPDVVSRVCTVFLYDVSLHEVEPFGMCPPAEGSESDIICALISKLLCHNNSNKHPNSPLLYVTIPALMTNICGGKEEAIQTHTPKIFKIYRPD